MTLIYKDTIIKEFDTLCDIHRQLLKGAASIEEYDFLRNKIKQYEEAIDIINRLIEIPEETICERARSGILCQVEEFLKDFIAEHAVKSNDHVVLAIDNLLKEFYSRFEQEQINGKNNK